MEGKAAFIFRPFIFKNLLRSEYTLDDTHSVTSVALLRYSPRFFCFVECQATKLYRFFLVCGILSRTNLELALLTNGYTT